jgi:hypothetical protein
MGWFLGSWIRELLGYETHISNAFFMDFSVVWGDLAILLFYSMRGRWVDGGDFLSSPGACARAA